MTTYGRHFVELAARLGPQDSKKAAQDFHSNRSPARTNIALLIPDRSPLRKRVRPLAILPPILKKKTPPRTISSERVMRNSISPL